MERSADAAAAPTRHQLLVKPDGRRPLFASHHRQADAGSAAGPQPLPRPTTRSTSAAMRTSTQVSSLLQPAHRARYSQGGDGDDDDDSNNGHLKPTAPYHGRLAKTANDINNNNNYHYSHTRRDHHRAHTADPHSARPSSSRSAISARGRRQISLAEAFRIAGNEQPESDRAVDASPSPAPRPSRSSRGPVLEPNGARSSTQAPPSLRSDPPAQLDKLPMEARPRSSLRDRLHDWTSRPDPAPRPRPSLLPREDEVPSSERSFAWQVDHDFTAGELQVSDSPPVRTTNGRPSSAAIDDPPRQSPARPPPQLSSRNRKLDEIRAREIEARSQIPLPTPGQARQKNTKLDEIRRREAFGLSRRDYAAARLEEIREQNSLSRSLSPDQPPVASLKLAAAASARPAARVTRAESKADTPVKVYRGGDMPGHMDAAASGAITDASLSDKGDKPQSDPSSSRKPDDSRDLLRRLARATSFSPSGVERGTEAAAVPPSSRRSDPHHNPGSGLATSDANLAQTTSAAAEASSGKTSSRPTVGFARLRRPQSTDSSKSQASSSSLPSEMDPTDRIEAEMKLFAPHDYHSERGSVRAPSPAAISDPDTAADAAVDDRGQDARARKNGEADEGGIKRNSGDAKSTSKEEAEMATPRPLRNVPANSQTPRVTGAYVDTPVTVKVEKAEEGRGFAGERAAIARRHGDDDTASDPGPGADDDDDDDKDIGRGTMKRPAVAHKRRTRSRSLPRRRPVPKNSANPPSVRDDLLELQRIHNIDDSTMDNLEEILMGQLKSTTTTTTTTTPSTNPVTSQPAATIDAEATSKKADRRTKETGPEEKSELAAFHRMSKTLRTGLLGIRTAKQGIERLEDRFSSGDSKDPALSSKGRTVGRGAQAAAQEDDAVVGDPSQALHAQTVVAYVQLPLPRLYHRAPRFRLTLLGLALALVCLWYGVEAAMCARYCRPTSCSLGPCVYSFDDPTFGYALPVKLDEWLTGGRGRHLVARALDEADDWATLARDALMPDLASPLASSLSSSSRPLSPEQRRRLRRRRRWQQQQQQQSPPGASASLEPGPEQKAKWEAWRRTRLARERAREAREMGYQVDDGYHVGDDGEADEILW